MSGADCVPFRPRPGLPLRGAPLGLWSQAAGGVLASSAVGDEEIRFVPSDKRVRRLRSHGEWLLTKEFRLGLNRHRSLKWASALTGWKK